MKNSKITLVGAGPGDADLITVKGLTAIQQANVILYDALVNRELLDEAPNAIKIYVGKRANKHAYSQDEINLMLVQNALNYGNVVRLKGGDPFIFGRGHEEIDYAHNFNIETEVIPGLSASTSLTTLQNVPLTRRGINESFWVMTGTTRNGKLSNDIQIAAQTSATIVILMGIRKLRQITEIFRQQGKGEMPVMIVQNGSWDNEKIALGTVNSIVKIAEAEQIGTPGIIVIGEVVGLHPQLALDYLVTIKNEKR
ncbi:MAG: uroporphyrinogen-III C-methyltransferase [Saprospiraceae bacterium]